MKGGWAKFYDRILDWRWYTDGNTFRLFFHLIMTASHKDKPWKDIVVRRGQRIASYDSLAEELQLSQRQVRTALEHLKSTGEVTSKTTSKYSIITVVNYDKYQAKYAEIDDDNDKQATSKTTNEKSSKRQASDKQATTSIDSTDIADSTEGIRESGTCPSPSPSTPSDPVPYNEIVKDYNDHCQGLPKVKALTEMRRRAIRARWNANKADAFNHFRELFAKAGKSDFLNGINDRAWIADFDWLMKEQNAVKVLEGKYDNTARAPAGLKPPQYKEPQETQQQKNNRILDEMMIKAQEEERINAGKQASDIAALEAHKY